MIIIHLQTYNQEKLFEQMDRRDKFLGEFSCEVCRNSWRSIIHDYEYSVLEACANCRTICCVKEVSDYYLNEPLNNIEYLKMCVNFVSDVAKITTEGIGCNEQRQITFLFS